MVCRCRDDCLALSDAEDPGADCRWLPQLLEPAEVRVGGRWRYVGWRGPEASQFTSIDLPFDGIGLRRRIHAQGDG